MENKIKKTMSTMAVCLLIFTVFSALMVYAPPPEDGINTPFQNVVVVNDESEPIPVVVGNQLETLEVIVPDGVEVTNPADESLNVIITNTENLPVDVSKWLHTTEVKASDVVDVDDFGRDIILYIDTEGYKEILLLFTCWSSDADCEFFVKKIVSGDGFAWSEVIDIFTVSAGSNTQRTYDLMGTEMWIEARSLFATDDATVSANYYMTT